MQPRLVLELAHRVALRATTTAPGSAWRGRGPSFHGQPGTRETRPYERQVDSRHAPALSPGSLAMAGRGLNTAPGPLCLKRSCHNFCATVPKHITYEELKKQLTSKNIMLIDVRETWEILQHGKIPGSINIPLNEVGEALQMNPEDFKEKYHEVKPSKSDTIVFSCLAGVRSKKAMDTALSLGFSSAQHYAGGWKEWVMYEFPEKQQGH